MHTFLLILSFQRCFKINCAGCQRWIAASLCLLARTHRANLQLTGHNASPCCCRGQVIRVHAPWVKHYMNANMENYIIPNTDSVVLGGTTQKGNWDTTVSQEVRMEAAWPHSDPRGSQLVTMLQHQGHYPTTPLKRGMAHPGLHFVERGALP